MCAVEEDTLRKTLCRKGRNVNKKLVLEHRREESHLYKNSMVYIGYFHCARIEHSSQGYSAI